MWWKYFPGTPIVLGCVEHGVSPQGMIDSCGEKKLFILLMHISTILTTI